MEKLIQSIVAAMGQSGVTDEDIHDSIIEKGWSEDDAFLAMKAAAILYKDQVDFQLAQMKRASFRRV
jgi:hypothetical protein